MHECSSRALILFPTICQLDVELTVDERNLLSVAYKNVVADKRAAVHPFSAVHVSHNHTSDFPRKCHIQVISKYKFVRPRVFVGQWRIVSSIGEKEESAGHNSEVI